MKSKLPSTIYSVLLAYLLVVSAVVAQTKQSKHAEVQPRYQVKFQPAQAQSTDHSFQTMQASLPEKAIRIYLHRIKADPNTFAGLLSAGGINSSAGMETVPSLNGPGTVFDTANSPRIMTPAGNAVPQMTSGASFFH
jgi:hypothetical protein